MQNPVLDSAFDVITTDYRPAVGSKVKDEYGQTFVVAGYSGGGYAPYWNPGTGENTTWKTCLGGNVAYHPAPAYLVLAGKTSNMANFTTHQDRAETGTPTHNLAYEFLYSAGI